MQDEDTTLNAMLAVIARCCKVSREVSKSSLILLTKKTESETEVQFFCNMPGRLTCLQVAQIVLNELFRAIVQIERFE